MRNFAEQLFLINPNDSDSNDDGYQDSQGDENADTIADVWDPANRPEGILCAITWPNPEDYVLLESYIGIQDSSSPPASELEFIDLLAIPPRKVQRIASSSVGEPFFILERGGEYEMTLSGYSAPQAEETLASANWSTNTHPLTTFQNDTNQPEAMVIGNADGYYEVRHPQGKSYILFNSLLTCEDIAELPDYRATPVLPAPGGASTSILYLPRIDLDRTGTRACDQEEDELDPGWFIAFNGDDDNTNSIPDHLDTDLAEADDDLMELNIVYGPENLLLGEIRLEALSGTNLIKVWSNEFKEAEIVLPASWVMTNGYPETIYLEGVNVSTNITDTAELVLSYVIAETACGEGSQVGLPFSMIVSNQVNIKVLNPRLIPDWDRDGSINTNDENRVSAANPYRFWVNDDDDKTADAKTGGDNDIPDDTLSPDSASSTIDGERDLVDFFPVYVDLKNTLDLLGTNEYRYSLQNFSGDLGIVYPELSATNAPPFLS